MADILDTSKIPGTKPVELKDDNPWVSKATATLGGIEVPADPAALPTGEVERPKSQSNVIELAHEAHESNSEKVKKHRPQAIEKYVDEKGRIRNLMHIHEFCRKLNNILGPAIDGQSRIVINNPPPLPGFDSEKMKGLFVKPRGMDQFIFHTDLLESLGTGWKKICAVQVPYMAEWGIMHLDSHGLFKSWKYIGWRGQVLLRLILAEVISEEEAHKEFGAPFVGDDVDSEYFKKLNQWRQHGKRTAN